MFKLRGGLGNQLFQVAGVANLAMDLDLVVIFSDSDVRLNQRDMEGAAAFKFHIENLFNHKRVVYRSGKFIDFFLKIRARSRLLSLWLPEVSEDIPTKELIRPIYVMNGYMQNKKTVVAISPSILVRTFGILDIPTCDRNIIAMHIRGTDALFLKSMNLSYQYYEKALQALEPASDSKIHVYSDDLKFAQHICSRIGGKNFEFMERNIQLSPENLLLKLSSYNVLISSKSTLCWWAAMLACTRNPFAVIVSPWSSDLGLDNWINLH